MLYPALDPRNVQLPPLFVVCIIGARGDSAGGISLGEPSLLDELAGEIRTVNPSIRVEMVECDTTSSASVEARSYD
ncbi:NAD(P)-binding protein [Penicillium canescens]|nr:NAD(P)-binding protein [Penicillium canescens]